MERSNTNKLFVNLLDNYNQAFYDKDINQPDTKSFPVPAVRATMHLEWINTALLL